MFFKRTMVYKKLNLLSFLSCLMLNFKDVVCYCPCPCSAHSSTENNCCARNMPRCCKQGGQCPWLNNYPNMCCGYPGFGCLPPMCPPCGYPSYGCGCGCGCGSPAAPNYCVQNVVVGGQDEEKKKKKEETLPPTPLDRPPNNDPAPIFDEESNCCTPEPTHSYVLLDDSKVKLCRVVQDPCHNNNHCDDPSGRTIVLANHPDPYNEPLPIKQVRVVRKNARDPCCRKYHKRPRKTCITECDCTTHCYDPCNHCDPPMNDCCCPRKTVKVVRCRNPCCKQRSRQYVVADPCCDCCDSSDCCYDDDYY